MTRPSWTTTQVQSLSTPMGEDYVVIGLDIEVQPLVGDDVVPETLKTKKIQEADD